MAKVTFIQGAADLIKGLNTIQLPTGFQILSVMDAHHFPEFVLYYIAPGESFDDREEVSLLVADVTAENLVLEDSISLEYISSVRRDTFDHTSSCSSVSTDVFHVYKVNKESPKMRLIDESS